MRNHQRLALLLVASAATWLASEARATTITASGTLALVVTDTGTSSLSATPLGTSIEMIFEYSDACPGDCVAAPPETDEANFDFPGSTSSFTFGTLEFGGPTNVNVQNDHALSAEEAAVASLVLGTTVIAGTLVDVWTVGGSDGSVSFELNMLSFDTSLFSDLAFQGVPPAASAVDAVVLQILANDGASYQAFSQGASIAVPEPRALAGLLLAALTLAARRRVRGRSVRPG